MSQTWPIALFFSAGLTKLDSACPREPFEKMFTKKVRQHLWTLTKNALASWIKLLTTMSEFTLRVQKKILSSFSSNSPFQSLSRNFRRFVEKFSAVCQKLVQRLETENLNIFTSSGKKFLSTFCGYSACVFRLIVKNFSTMFSKQHSTCVEERLGNLISEGNFFLQFRTLIEIFPPFCQNFNHGVVKNAFKMSRGTFWAKRIFKLKRSF